MPDHHPSDDDTEERAIYIFVYLDNDPDVTIDLDDEWINVDDHANDHELVAVYRALHDRRPALYHGGEPDDDAASCTWCAELAARAPGDGVTP